MDNQFSAILHTLTGDGHIDQVFASFTDEDKFVAWAEDFLANNPNVDLYYSMIPLNPNPGERTAISVDTARLVNLYVKPRQSLLERAKADLSRLLSDEKLAVLPF